MAFRMDYIQKLIATVKRRPVLYNKSLKEYSNKELKEKAWREVYEELVPNWHGLTDAERALRGKDVHQKWKNLRTCFRRELNFQMLGKSVHAGKKRSKYVYFDELLFLLPNAQDKDTPTRCKYYTLQTSSLEEKRNEGVTVMDIPEQTKPPAVTPSCSRPKKRASCSYGESPLNISQNKNGSLEFDDDKSFLMSLLPSFKSLKADQKMDLRIEMMQLVRNFHRGVAEAPATQSELACSLAIE